MVGLEHRGRWCGEQSLGDVKPMYGWDSLEGKQTWRTEGPASLGGGLQRNVRQARHAWLTVCREEEGPW